MAVDSATREFLDKAAAAATKPRHLMTPAEARAAFGNLRKLLTPGPDVSKVQDLAVPVQGASLPCRLFVPAGEPQALLVYFHGGGWVVGSIEEFDPLCRELAVRTGIAVALVEYRKAPEHAFPGPVDDAWTALEWLAKRQDALLGKSLPLLVGGDSAGGNLAIATTLLAREKKGPEIAGQLLIYPVTDCRLDRPSYTDAANQLMTNLDTMRYYWSHYVPDPAERQKPLASPCRASDLSSLPPAVVVTAEHDVLRDEGEEYAQLLRNAGVRVELRRFSGQMHGFLMMHGILPGSDDGVAFAAAALRRLLSATA